jgi:hypothetical protein
MQGLNTHGYTPIPEQPWAQLGCFSDRRFSQPQFDSTGAYGFQQQQVCAFAPDRLFFDAAALKGDPSARSSSKRHLHGSLSCVHDAGCFSTFTLARVVLLRIQKEIELDEATRSFVILLQMRSHLAAPIHTVRLDAVSIRPAGLHYRPCGCLPKCPWWACIWRVHRQFWAVPPAAGVRRRYGTQDFSALIEMKGDWLH